MFTMQALNPGIVSLFLVSGIATSAFLGVFARYSLRKTVFVQSGKSQYAEVAAVTALLALLIFCEVTGQWLCAGVAGFFLTAVYAFSIWGANPPWDE